MQPESTLGDVRNKRLLHEFKALYSVVPDDVIRSCVKKYGKDKGRCRDILASEAERLGTSHGGHAYARRSAFKALLDQQMSKDVALMDEFRKEFQHLQNLQQDEKKLEAFLQVRRQSILEEVTGENLASRLRNEVDVLGESCHQLQKRINILNWGGKEVVRSCLEAVTQSTFRSVSDLAAPSSYSNRGWTCSVCTLENHAALARCEACDMPRFMTGTADAGRLPYPADAGCFCHPQSPQPGPNLSSSSTQRKTDSKAAFH